MMMPRGFDLIFQTERELSKITGAPEVILTDCCTHALELCFRVEQVNYCDLPAHTYISVPMMLLKLGISFNYTDEKWVGEYLFGNTRIWDSARRLESNMYRKNSLQCLSFGYDKPLPVGRGGAILCDDHDLATRLRKMRSDGRDLIVTPWESQTEWELGFHYRPTIEEAVKISMELATYSPQSPVFKTYPDLRKINIKTV